MEFEVRLNEYRAEVTRLFATLNKFPEVVDKERPKILALAGAYMAASIESVTPVGSKVHYRYSTPKLVKRLRAPNGLGRKVATYIPGNLARSVQTLKMRRLKSGVIVGAKLHKGNAKGTFGSRARVDGFYQHMVEFGTVYASPQPHVERGFIAGRPQSLRVIEQGIGRVITQYKISTGL